MDASKDPCFGVAIYLIGHDLDPEAISKFLLVSPSRGWKRGDVSSREHHARRKNGLWNLSYKDPRFRAADGIESHVDRLLDVLSHFSGSLAELPGVERAWLDFFLASYADDDNQFFELTPATIQRIGQLGLSIQATFAAVER